MAAAHRKVVQSGKKPHEFVINTSAMVQLRMSDVVGQVFSFKDVPIRVERNDQRSPSVVLVTKEAIRKVEKK